MVEHDSPVPALNRGLSLLEFLNQRGSATIDDICTTFAWPRSSVNRVLKALEQHQCILAYGRPTRYYATKALRPVGSPLQARMDEILPFLTALAGDAGCSAEIFHLNEWQRYLELLTSASPPQQHITVRAPLGSQIRLNQAEAPVLAALATTQTEHPKHLVASDSRRQLTTQASKKLIDDGIANDWWACPQPNRYGALRIATPIRDDQQQTIAILSLAQVASPHHAWVAEHLAPIIQTYANKIHAALHNSSHDSKGDQQ